MLVPYNGGVGEGGSFDECVDDFLVWQFKWMKTSDQFSIPEQSLFMVQKLVTGLISNPWMNSVLLTIAKVQASATLILGRTFLWCGLFCTVPSVSKGFIGALDLVGIQSRASFC